MRNQDKINEGDLIIVTEKLHGTSGRCGYLEVHNKVNFVIRLLSWLAMKLLKDSIKFKNISFAKHQFVVGSRKVVKSIDGQERGGVNHYYDEDLWTKIAKENFEGKLDKGETVYFEIVGYTPNGQPIMGTHSNSKLKAFMGKKEYNEFICKYGEETVFSYGCSLKQHTTAGEFISNGGTIDGTFEDDYPIYYGGPENKIFVYRITRTDQAGEQIDLSWEQVKRRCEILGVDHVPELKKYFIQDPTDKKILEKEVDVFTHLDSNTFPQHLREGVCIRIENGNFKPVLLKHKNYYFRVLEQGLTEPSTEDIN